MVDTIGCFSRVVTNSTTTGCNKAQLVRLPTGEVEVQFHYWTRYLQLFFKSIPRITSYHVFRVDSTIPNTIFMRELSSSSEKSLLIGYESVSDIMNSTLPDRITPLGLDLQRQRYLYDKIRQYCSTNLSADITCPKPLLPKHVLTDHPSQHPEEEPSSSRGISSEIPRKGLCSICKASGHNKRSCPSNICTGK